MQYIQLTALEIRRNSGLHNNTEAQAKWASRQMRKFNRLLCYLNEHTDNILEDIAISVDSKFAGGVSISMNPTWIFRKKLDNKIKSGEVEL